MLKTILTADSDKSNNFYESFKHTASFIKFINE